MGEFIMLIAEILFVAVVQTIAEEVLSAEKYKNILKVINIACIIVCYVLLFRYIHGNLWSEFSMFINI